MFVVITSDPIARTTLDIIGPFDDKMHAQSWAYNTYGPAHPGTFGVWYRWTVKEMRNAD